MTLTTLVLTTALGAAALLFGIIAYRARCPRHMCEEQKCASASITQYLGLGMSVGIGTGSAMGVAVDNLALGIGMGIGVGVAIVAGTAHQNQASRTDSTKPM